MAAFESPFFLAGQWPGPQLHKDAVLCSCAIESWKQLILHELNAAPQFHGPKRGRVFYLKGLSGWS